MNPDDPKFTAHALGETEDLTPAEHAEIEALLASDPSAAAEADELRSLAARLRAELPGEEAGVLQAEQRVAIMGAATPTIPEEKIVRFAWRRVLKVAAVVAAFAIVGGLVSLPLSDTTEKAHRSAEIQPVAARIGEEPPETRWQDLGGLIASNPEPAPALSAPPETLSMPNATLLPATPRPLELATMTTTNVTTPTFNTAPLVSDPRGGDKASTRAELEKLKEASGAAPASAPLSLEVTTKAPVADGKPLSPEIANKIAPFSSGWAKGGTARRAAFKDGTQAEGAPSPAAEAPAATSTGTGDRGTVADHEKVKQLYVEAQGFYDTGRFDLAKKRSEQILGIDKQNIAARNMQEKIDRKISDYGVAAYNGTRGEAIKQVDLAWQRPIRLFASAEVVPVPMPARTDVGTLSADKVTPSSSGKAELSAALAGSLPASAAKEATEAKKAFEAGDYTRAGEIYKSMDAQLPNNAYVLSNLGVTRFREGRYDEATEALKKATAAAPNDAYSHMTLGIVHYSQSKYDEAVNSLTKALALDPSSATAHNYLGITASQKGWQEAAVKELETASRLDPAYADASFNLAVTLAMQNPPNKSKAYWYYRRAISLGAEPDSALEKIIGNPDPQTSVDFAELAENGFLAAKTDPLSTFSIDVDTASYSMVRKFLRNDQQPPKGSVRIEELLNYFTYDYAPPKDATPFSAAMEVAACPWAPEHRLVRVALKGREMDKNKRPASNLVFLIDVSGSMRPENKLPLLKESLEMLVDELSDEDKVAIVVYAGNSGCVLESTNDKGEMRAALRRLEAGGSTNGGSGVELAYKLAEKSFIKGGTNRVILATDGDWNVGITNRDALVDLIKRKAKGGVFLTVLGVGMDNLKDATLVKLADSGNGNYAYLDTVNEAKKVLVKQLSGTLVTIAKDVKIQVEFNPAQVDSYRLIGYEKRMLAKEDFNNDKKDAGEIGAGHTVTALYEVVPVGVQRMAARPAVDGLKYQPAPAAAATDLPLNGPANPGDAFVNAYMAVQAAEKAEQNGDLRTALEKYQQAAKTFELVASASPDWQPQIVEFRKQRTATSIARVQEALERAGQATAGAKPEGAQVEAKTRTAAPNPATAASKEMLTLKLRYKEPEGETSKLLEFPLVDGGMAWEKSSADFRFAAAVAGYGMLLRDSQYKGDANWSTVAEWAEEGKGTDESGYRAEFLKLVDKARAVCR